MDKDCIVNSSRSVFYDFGVEKTTLKQIAEACNTTTSLIRYYYDSKESILADLVRKYSLEIDSVIGDWFYSHGYQYDIFNISQISMMLQFELYRRDPQARKVYIDYLNSGLRHCFVENFEKTYRDADRARLFNLDRSYDQIPLLATAYHGMLLSVHYMFFSGRLNCTEEQINDYLLLAFCRSTGFSDDAAQTEIDKVKKIFSQMKISIEPYFHIKLD